MTAGAVNVGIGECSSRIGVGRGPGLLKCAFVAGLSVAGLSLDRPPTLLVFNVKYYL